MKEKRLVDKLDLYIAASNVQNKKLIFDKAKRDLEEAKKIYEKLANEYERYKKLAEEQESK